MAYKHYTECIEPSEYTTLNHMLVATFQSLLVGATGAAVMWAASRPDCKLQLAMVIATAWVIAYCRLFLYQRLICLGGDRDVIGLAVQAYSSALTDFPDNDFKINLLLQCTEFGDKHEVVKAGTPYGFLVGAHEKITTAGLPFKGYEIKDIETETLHCEFEGAGAYVWLLSAEIGFAAAVAALILCVYLPPIPFLHEIIMILTLLAILALILGGLIALGTGGSASDANPTLGEIHTNSGDKPEGGDILYINGTWVFDPWHDGWNEIHPVKECCKVDTWRGNWAGYDCNTPDIILRLRRGFQEAKDQITQTNQTLPEHKWQIHPDLDGCSREIIL